MQELKGCLPGGGFESLAGKTIAITGAASGFGRLMAIKCANLGATVIISDVNTAQCAQTAAEASAGSGRCFAMPEKCDVTRAESQEAFFEFAKKTLGHSPDVVVCNAGVTELGQVTNTRTVTKNDLGVLPVEPNMTTLRINFNGMLLTAELAVTQWEAEAAENGGIRKRGPGKIILLASLAGVSACPGAETYCWSKHGMLGYWLAACDKIRRRKEAGGDQLYSCDAICPFFSATAILDPAILCFLAGLAKVAPDTIAACVVALMNRPMEIGSAVFLPDDQDPWISSDLDFRGSLQQDWETIVVKRKSAPSRKEYWQRVGADVGFAFKLTPLKLCKLGGAIVAIAIAVIFVNRSVSSLGALWAITLGASAAVASKALSITTKGANRH